jgi:cbb3-type cytochrome oxidase subunit 1
MMRLPVEQMRQYLSPFRLLKPIYRYNASLLAISQVFSTYILEPPHHIAALE